MGSAAVALTASAGQAQAQGTETGLAVGIAVPVYEAAAVHLPGPHVQVYGGRPVGERLQLRLGGGFTLLTGRKLDPSEGYTRGPLTVLHLDGSVVFTPSGNGRGLYGMAGAGVYALAGLWGGRRTNDAVPGISVGAGLNFERANLPLFVQVRAEVPFSSLGTDTESAPTVYLPVSLGIRFP